MEILLTVLAGIVVAETSGYLMHRLLHSNRIEFLSRSHMIHHLVQYGPKTGLRSEQYKSPILDNRFSIANIGAEWWIPIILVYGVFAGVFYLLGISWTLFGIFSAVVGFWGFFFYNYMHDSMHLEHFWMLRNRWFKGFMLNARHHHDIHHLNIDNDGRMNKNFGICFFWHDRLFKTFEKRFLPFNEKGYAKAKTLYSYINLLLKQKEQI